MSAMCNLCLELPEGSIQAGANDRERFDLLHRLTSIRRRFEQVREPPVAARQQIPA